MNERDETECICYGMTLESLCVSKCAFGFCLCVCLCVCTYDQDVVELLHSVNLGQQLVDHSVMDSCAACHASTLLTDCINLIKYDDVKATVGTKLLSRQKWGEN